MVERAAWSGPTDVRAMFGSADFVANNRVAFDIKGNTYRLVAQIKYGPLFLVFIRFVGTHAEYELVRAADPAAVLLARESDDTSLGAVLDDLKPENRYYVYDHFFNNCTTILRDLIEPPHPFELLAYRGGRRKAALRSGVSDETFFTVIKKNVGNSGLVALKEPKLRADDFSPQFSVKHMLKDMRLASRTTGCEEMPMLDTVRQCLHATAQAGYADEDFSALIRLLQPQDRRG